RLAPHIRPNFWVERRIGRFGQSLGVTATGLVLMRVVDAEAKTPAYPAFGYKQLVFEPFFGGGLVTAAAIPLSLSPLVGPWAFTAIMAVTLAVALFFGLFVLTRWRRSGATPWEQAKSSSSGCPAFVHARRSNGCVAVPSVPVPGTFGEQTTFVGVAAHRGDDEDRCPDEDTESGKEDGKPQRTEETEQKVVQEVLL